MNSPITHLTFDFFGTLVDYKPGHFSGDKKHTKTFALLQKNKYTHCYETFIKDYSDIFNTLTEQSLIKQKEFHMDEVTDTFFQKNRIITSKQIKNTFTETYLQEWNTNVVYHPNIKEFINHLKKKYSLSIISNTHYPPLVMNNLKNMEIEKEFDLIITSVEHGSLKPYADIFHDTLQELSASPSQTIHIGDSYADDFIGATNAGVRCIFIDPKMKYEGKISDRVNSLFDIEQFL
jgi:putative hydrolase of the HAD superfamily